MPTLRAQVKAVDGAAATAAKKAPDDIKARVSSVIGPLHILNENLAKATTRTAATRALSQYRKDVAKINNDLQVLNLWIAAHCGVVPVTTTTVAVTIAPGATG